MAAFKHRPLEFAPGSQYRYSNSDCFLLRYIIEKISGKRYAAPLKQRILEPLGQAERVWMIPV